MTTTDELAKASWNLSTSERRHRVEILGSVTRTVSWYVDDELVATKKSSADDLRLEPGVELDPRSADATPLDQSDVGTIRVTFTDLGRPKRVTWFEGQDDVAATARALVGIGGIDLDPEPGSPAALRAERIRRHPRRHAALALAGGIAKVGIPLLIGYFAIRFTVNIPWPDLNLPSIPWPDWDLPAIPWPDHLPDLAAPAWVTWLVDHLHYVWPVILAGFLARAEIKRQRQQDALKAQLTTEVVVDDPSEANQPSSSSKRSISASAAASDAAP